MFSLSTRGSHARLLVLFLNKNSTNEKYYALIMQSNNAALEYYQTASGLHVTFCNCIGPLKICLEN